MQRTSIFVGFTPYHAYAATPIIEDIDGEIYCAFTKTWPATTRSYKTPALLSAWPVPGKNTITFLSFALLIKRLIARRHHLDVYLPHPGHILSNYLFFASIPNKRLFLYEDGLLNYYDADAKNSFVSVAKRSLARLVGMPYRDYTGHIAGYDHASYTGAFLSSPANAVRKERLGQLFKINFHALNISVNTNTVLFLDQDTENRLSKEQRNRYIEAMLEHFPQPQFSYFYKPHHDFVSALSNNMQPVAEGIRNQPAEALVETLRPSHVISFYSSALINIKNCWPNVVCVSLAAANIAIKRDQQPTTLEALFEEAGVTCLRC